MIWLNDGGGGEDDIRTQPVKEETNEQALESTVQQQ